MTRRQILLYACIAGWVVAVAGGLTVLENHAFTPGERGSPTEAWPAETAVQRTPNVHTVLVSLHPECPCSRATLTELESVLVNTKGKLRAVLIFADSEAHPAAKSALYRRARQIPDCTVIADSTGAELRRFSFRTSGETRLYAPDGYLSFQGGITASRGHEGDNPGRSAIIALAQGRSVPLEQTRTPVFGCSLENPSKTS